MSKCKCDHDGSGKRGKDKANNCCSCGRDCDCLGGSNKKDSGTITKK